MWVRHIASMGRGEVNTKFSWGNLKERDHLEDLDVDVSIIIKVTYKAMGWEGMDQINLALDRNNL